MPRYHGTLYVWALGVGIVVCGQYFGWNLGLKENGPVSMLVASLLVCLLFLAWVLTLAELSVPMSGPVEYGRRAGSNLLGFVMGWSMLLECQFGAIATALASGSYVAFLVNHTDPDPLLRVWVGLGTVVLFFFLQAWGFKEQAWTQIVMTCAALVGLILYWSIASTNFSWERAWPTPDPFVGKGWEGVLDAIPYALWWLIIIEGVALAAEQINSPERSIPRGLVLGMMTIITMMLLTLGLGCGALDWQQFMKEDYPLSRIVQHVVGERSPILLHAFTSIALFGLIASYHGLFYSVSRQAYALGREGFLPRIFGRVHANRNTPVPALLASSLVTAGFLVGSLWFSREAVDTAILVAGLSSLIWYILAMICLFILRRGQPQLFSQYQAPVRQLLPITVLLLSVFTVCVYGGIKVQVLPLAVVLYALGFLCYWYQRRSKGSDPATDGWLLDQKKQDLATIPAESSKAPSRLYFVLESLTGGALVVVMLAVAWIILAAFGIETFRLSNSTLEVYLILAIVSVALALVSAVALLHVRHRTTQGNQPQQ